MMTIDGFAPGQAGFEGHAGNHQAIRDWLLVLGCEPARVEGMRPANLFKAFRYPEYLRCMTQRKDYFPNGLQDISEELGQCNPTTTTAVIPAATNTTPTRPDPLPALIARGALKKSSVASTHAAEPTTPQAPAKTPSTSPPDKSCEALAKQDPVAALTNMIQEFAKAGHDNGLTEARVIELIREHVPQMVLQTLRNLGG
jgi:hypothetical protein